MTFLFLILSGLMIQAPRRIQTNQILAPVILAKRDGLHFSSGCVPERRKKQLNQSISQMMFHSLYKTLDRLQQHMRHSIMAMTVNNQNAQTLCI